MQQLIGALSDVYNFIECPNVPSVPINIELLNEFDQVRELLKDFFERETNDAKEIFQQLQHYITMEQDVFGPRKFIRMIEAISAVTFQYILRRLREGIVDKAVLCLTYFERTCNRYFTSIIKVNIFFVYALAHIKNRNFSMAEEYINTCNQILRVEERTKKGEGSIGNLWLILYIFDSITNYQKGNYSKAKCILSDIISKVTSKIQQEKAKLKRISLETVSFFVLSTYYLSKVYGKMNLADISAYNLTQCLQFASNYHNNPQPLIARCTQTSSFLIKKSVKLSRIQHKIQRIKPLHSLNSFLPNQGSSQQPNKHTKHPSFKISKMNYDNKEREKKINRELNRLFIVDEKSEAQIKKRTLNTLRIENQQKQNKISCFKHQMYEFAKQKQQITMKYQNQLYQNELDTQNTQKMNIKDQLFHGLWDVVGTLKPTKKIESYMKCFKTYIYYELSTKFMRFISESVNLKGQMKLFCFLNKYRTHLHRQFIHTLEIKGVKHQIEYLMHTVNKTCHIKVYQIQKGTGVNEELVVSSQDYANLKKEPLSLYFEVVDSKMIPLVNYILTLKKSVQYRMKIFAIRLKNRLKRFRGELYHRKQTVNINFNSYNTVLQYTLFISSRKMADGTFTHALERIDPVKYFNDDYNVTFRRNIASEQSHLCESELQQLLTAQMLVKKAKHIKYIIRLQDCIRLRLSIKHMKTLKQSISVTTTIINKTIFTFVEKGTEKIFYIENLQKKYPIVVLKDVCFSNISFINKLRTKIQLIDDCAEQLLLIHRYFKLRQFAIMLIKKSKQATLNSRFQSKFKKSLCFAKFMNRFLYKGKYFKGKVMYMLIVKDFQSFPRPYLLRVFTVQSHSLFSIDFQKIIYSSEKLFLQNHLGKINEFIDLQGVKEANVLSEGPPMNVVNKSRRSNSKSTIVSNYTFGCRDDFIKEAATEKANSKMMGQNRLSYINSRKRNSINSKMRHKSALKQRDILLIKKWIENSKEDQQISQSSRSNSS